MTANIFKINENKIVGVVIRIKTEGEKIIIAVRDNGKAFNPLEYQPQENLRIKNIDLLIELPQRLKKQLLRPILFLFVFLKKTASPSKNSVRKITGNRLN